MSEAPITATLDLDEAAVRRSLIEALGDFSRLSRASDSMDTKGFSRLQVTILTRLAKHGPARLTDLAADLVADLSVVSRQAAHLTDRGFLARERDPHDGRACIVTITPAGREVVDAVRARRDQWLERVLEPWATGDVAQAATIVRTIVAEIHAAQP